ALGERIDSVAAVSTTLLSYALIPAAFVFPIFTLACMRLYTWMSKGHFGVITERIIGERAMSAIVPWEVRDLLKKVSDNPIKSTVTAHTYGYHHLPWMFRTVAGVVYVTCGAETYAIAKWWNRDEVEDCPWETSVVLGTV
ncbi:MAG: hypothetical protein MN733_00350, partial [Nitrososphaera sp.]|nr:hypothetical protein [Nitrososphaera sp.]